MAKKFYPHSRKNELGIISPSTPDGAWQRAAEAVLKDPENLEFWEGLLTVASDPDGGYGVNTARSVFDGLLTRFPLLFGYWLKYVEYEKMVQSDAVELIKTVYERAVSAFPNSVDLWSSYLDYVVGEARAEGDEQAVRALFDRAVKHCGLDFLGHEIWDRYLAFETDPTRVRALYDQIITIPMHQYARYIEAYRELITQDDQSADAAERLQQSLAQTSKATNDRWDFESKVTRNYFHVVPVEDDQLELWRSYLTFSAKNEQPKLTQSLFERALVPCALYDEFWLRYIRFLQAAPDASAADISQTFSRASLLVSISRPFIRLQWSLFEESQGNIEGARNILAALSQTAEADFATEIRLHRVHFERRHSIAYTTEFLISHLGPNQGVFAASLANIYWKDKNDIESALRLFESQFDNNQNDKFFVVNYFVFLLQTQPNIVVFNAWKRLLAESGTSPVLLADVSRTFLDHLSSSSEPNAMSLYVEVDREANGPLLYRKLWDQKTGPNTSARLALSNGHPGVEIDPFSTGDPFKKYNDLMTAL